MASVTFITGNQRKADYLAKYLDVDIAHQKVELEEIQSLDLCEVVAYKARRAYEVVGSPVLVEDVSLEFCALGRLPGTFIKFFIEETPLDTICRMLDGLSREAIARCVYGYYDGTAMQFFEGSLMGTIAETPAGEGGYGWDMIFIPEGYDVTRAQMNEADDRATYLKIKPLAAVKDYLLKQAPKIAAKT